MMHLHSLKVLHRDLKLANVLIHFPEISDCDEVVSLERLKQLNLRKQKFIVKIADLGFSKM